MQLNGMNWVRQLIVLKDRGIIKSNEVDKNIEFYHWQMNR